MRQIVLIAMVISLSLFGCAEEPTRSLQNPISDLGHIDVVLDSITWNAIKNDPFIQNEFSVLEVDTAYYAGKPSYDIYLLGKMNFLHLSQAKGFWNHQRGGGVLIFQTQKPGLKDSLVNSWKQYFADSLFVHTYQGADFTLDEIMAWYNEDTTKIKEATLFANLTTYSKEAYKNWGITDSIIDKGLAMQQFMKSWGGEPLETRLFDSITELYITMNQREYIEIKSALLAVGYEENNNKFTHPANPTVYLTISEAYKKSKYTKVKFKLTRSIAEKEIVFSPMATLKFSDDMGWLLFN